MSEEPIDTTAALERQLALDLLPCEMAPSAIVKLGLNPSSPEGHEIEHIMSHARMDKVQPLAGPLHVYAAVIADIWTKLFLEQNSNAEIPDHMRAYMYQNQIARIVESSATILANMIDAGMITYGEAFRNGI